MNYDAIQLYIKTKISQKGDNIDSKPNVQSIKNGIAYQTESLFPMS